MIDQARLTEAHDTQAMGRAEAPLLSVHAELCRTVQGWLRRLNQQGLRGLVRLIYTVTAEGRMTNVRADIIEERPSGTDNYRSLLIRQQFEASMAACLEGHLLPLLRVLDRPCDLVIGRQQSFLSLTEQLH